MISGRPLIVSLSSICIDTGYYERIVTEYVAKYFNSYKTHWKKNTAKLKQKTTDKIDGPSLIYILDFSKRAKTGIICVYVNCIK